MDYRWRVEERDQIAHFLQKKMGVSGKKIRRLLEKNCCKINGRIERFGSVWVEKGSVVEFTSYEEEPSSWAVLLDSEFFQILDKPMNWVCSEQNCEKTFGRKLFLVHRLDKDTTGALLFAKNTLVRDELMALFATREVAKEYIALVDGIVSQDRGIIDNFLSKKGSFQGQTIWGASSKGDHAITEWEVLSRGALETLVLCKPLTGRTHQIRVHMAEMGHPILIDRQYATRFRSKIFATRPLLHAYRLRFSYRGESISVLSPIPPDLKMYVPPGILE
jgi:RluA family pseudouridine synthase